MKFDRKPALVSNVLGGIKALSYLWVCNRFKNLDATWESWRTFDLVGVLVVFVFLFCLVVLFFVGLVNC